MIDAATWDPPPRRPSMIPAVIGLVLVLIWAGGAVYGLFWGLSARYAQRAETCAALDVTAFATLLGDPKPEVKRSLSGGCLIGITGDQAASSGTVALNYLSSTAEARFSYAYQAEATGVDLPGLRGHLWVDTTPAATSCLLSAHAQRSNLVVSWQLRVAPGSRRELCSTGDAVIRSVTTSLRSSLDRLAG